MSYVSKHHYFTLVTNFLHFTTFSLFRKTAFNGCKITNFVRFYLLPIYLQDEHKTPFSLFIAYFSSHSKCSILLGYHSQNVTLFNNQLIRHISPYKPNLWLFYTLHPHG